MNNGLGINFFRYVNEEDDNRWSQVYAKLPFDETDAEQKGALFGAIETEKIENWAELDMEITNWVDSFFNSSEDAPLADFFTTFIEKYPDLRCVWCWVFIKSGKRFIRMTGNSDAIFFIQRGDKKIDLTQTVRNEKVLSGEVLSGDEVYFGVGAKVESIDIEKELLEIKEVYGYLKIKVENLETKTAPIETVEKKETVVQEDDLVSDKYVGKTNWFTHIRSLPVFNKRKIEISSEGGVNRKKLSLVLGVVFGVLLILSLLGGKIKKDEQVSENKWIEFSQPIEKVLSEAVGIGKINQDGAKKMVEDARQKYNSGKEEFANDNRLTELDNKINSAWSEVSGEVNTAITEVLNLELIRAGVNADRFGYMGDGMFDVISSETGLVMSANRENKDIKVLAGKGAGLGWIDSVILKNNTYVLTKGGVFVAESNNNSLVFDSAVADPVAMSFFGSNLYILEKQNKEIFKYSVSETGFGDRQRWLKNDESISSIPVDMDLDVDIWILGQGNAVERFRRGSKEVFNMSGVTSSETYERIAVEEEGDNIALLSPKSSTITICSKETGQCNKQLKNDQIEKVKDIVYAEDKLYVLMSGSFGVIN